MFFCVQLRIYLSATPSHTPMNLCVSKYSHTLSGITAGKKKHFQLILCSGGSIAIRRLHNHSCLIHYRIKRKRAARAKAKVGANRAPSSLGAMSGCSFARATLEPSAYRLLLYLALILPLLLSRDRYQSDPATAIIHIVWPSPLASLCRIGIFLLAKHLFQYIIICV